MERQPLNYDLKKQIPDSATLEHTIALEQLKNSTKEDIELLSFQIVNTRKQVEGGDVSYEQLLRELTDKREQAYRTLEGCIREQSAFQAVDTAAASSGTVYLT